MSRPETPQTAVRPRPVDSTRVETDNGKHHCQGCGEHVSQDFRRVFGGNDGEVHACHSCASMSDLTSGATIGRETGGVR